jgi:hypothetical protein
MKEAKPDCAVCGQPAWRHSGGFPNTCPIIATYKPKEAAPLSADDAGLCERLRKGAPHMDAQDGSDRWVVDLDATDALLAEAAARIEALSRTASEEKE